MDTPAAAPAPAAASASASTAATSGTAVVSSAASSGGAAAAASSSSSSAPGPAGRFVLNQHLGFHFLPTDAELVVHYLRPRLAGLPLPLRIVNDVRVLDYHPERLIERYMEYGEDRWFFFTWRERKFASGSKPNRTTAGNGHWNATGSLRPIHFDGALVGCVGTLVFYEASRRKKKKQQQENGGPAPAKGAKTEWIMYEYESLTSQAEFEARSSSDGKIDALVLCTIQRKECDESKKRKKKKEEKGLDGIPAGVKGEKKGSRAGGKTTGKRKERSSQAQEEHVKRALMATPPQEQVLVPLGADNVSTYPDTNMFHCPISTSPLSTPSQEMMAALAGGGDSLNVHPDNVMQQSFDWQSMMSNLQAPTPQEYFPYEDPYFDLQDLDVDTMAQQSYDFQFPSQPSYGVGGSTRECLHDQRNVMSLVRHPSSTH